MTRHAKSGIAGTLAGVGLTVGGVALGALLAQRRSGGGDDAPRRTRRQSGAENALVGRTVTIGKPRDELYRFWKDFQNLPQVMENVERIRAEGDHHIWTIKAPAGTTVDLKTEIADDQPGKRIAWRSVEGSDIDTTGFVEFADAPGDRGTRVSLVIEYDPPMGELGRLAAKLFLREPEVQARHDLKRFKMLMETGEIATSAHRRDNTRAAKQQEKN
ncbi:cyclase [Erythrobacter sp. 3-20A1M]|uniref:SRPBCC family protein n=1 Tax=Erythrobacter sp. 3-20A1M TaxID=2653850 RepID=UPI001BFCCA99|nr:SRPBCC family protein [Erythrobacter sp. 3-20A1M]QWC57275.1 cyclase [Erythrobacter sp. 3-20A1M]